MALELERLALDSKEGVAEKLETAEKSTDEELRMAYYDGVMQDTLGAGSIYTYLWISKKARVEYILAFFMSIIIQLVVPAALVYQYSEYLPGPRISSIELSWDKETIIVKASAFLLSLFLLSTFTSALTRADTMIFMAPMLPGHSWCHILGGYAINTCILLSSVATIILFQMTPDLQDILLNCIALNFLPDVDTSMAAFAQIVNPAGVQQTRERINLFVEAYADDSKERMAVMRYNNLSYLDQWKNYPVLTFQRHLYVALLFCIVVMMVINTLTISPNQEEL